jgi:hypothetical protein
LKSLSTPSHSITCLALPYLVDGDRIVHLLSWHQVQNQAEVAASLKQLKEAGLIDESLVRLCVIGDGAQ